MKRKLLLASMIAFAVIGVTNGKASALEVTQTEEKPFSFLNINQSLADSITLEVQEEPPKEPEPEKKPEPPKPIEYVVVSGDHLTKIAEAHQTTWVRLWQKNTAISNPDVIHVGDKIVIPFADETLADRPLPVNAPPTATVCTSCNTQAPAQTAYARGDSSNTYDYGYCTWYVKNRRGASLPNGLGNANTWYSRAAGMGMSVGSTPRAGAVGTTTRGSLGHVVYVESVNGDGTINISEMNYKGFGITSSRTASASEFSYIY